MKRCSKCGKVFDASNFYKDKTHIDGLSNICKDCRREYMIEYRKHRLDAGLCYDCGKPLPEENPYQRYCIRCLKKREEYNKKSEQGRIEKGICRQCGKKPIDYTRSKLHCTSCLDLRNYNKINK